MRRASTLINKVLTKHVREVSQR